MPAIVKRRTVAFKDKLAAIRKVEQKSEPSSLQIVLHVGVVRSLLRMGRFASCFIERSSVRQFCGHDACRCSHLLLATCFVIVENGRRGRMTTKPRTHLHSPRIDKSGCQHRTERKCAKFGGRFPKNPKEGGKKQDGANAENAVHKGQIQNESNNTNLTRIDGYGSRSSPVLLLRCQVLILRVRGNWRCNHAN